MASVKALLVAGLAAAVSAQQVLWSQCGGQGYTGPTTCPSGAICLYSNPFYSQCIPAPASLTSTKPSTFVTSTKTSSSSVKPTSTTVKPSSTSSSIKTSSTSVKPSSTTVKISSTTTKTSSTSAAPTKGFKYFFVFGDSYSQTGFDITGTKPNSANLLGNPTFPGWTSAGSNGPNWIGNILSTYAQSPPLTYNFAYGGATTDATLVAPYATTVLSFIDQVAQFSGSVAPHPAYAPWTSADSLFGVWMGVNDVGGGYSQANWATTLPQIMTQYFKQLQILYNAGARNFVLLKVPPTNKSPMVLAQGAWAIENLGIAIDQYNAGIVSNLASFQAANPGTTAWIVDSSVAFNTALNNPTAYGAPDATCFNDNGVSCLWSNDYHPGWAIQKLLGQQVAATVGL